MKTLDEILSEYSHSDRCIRSQTKDNCICNYNFVIETIKEAYQAGIEAGLEEARKLIKDGVDF